MKKPTAKLERGLNLLGFLLLRLILSSRLRTTIPFFIVKQFNLKAGQELDWSMKAEGGELIIIVKPLVLKESKEGSQK